jgi:Polyketide cyclase / dehydrase and lipid transport
LQRYRPIVARSPCVIEYQRTFAFPVRAERLWTAMAQFDSFSAWWSWLREFSVDGVGLVAGTELHGVVEPPLPYRMRLDVVLDDCEPERRIGAAIHGDLEGTAVLRLECDDDETVVHVAWTIEMMQMPMRLAARFGHPLLRWGHDRVVDATVEGFRRHLFDEPAS